MAEKSVDIIRNELLEGNNDSLTFFYKKYRNDVIQILTSKNKANKDEAQDYFAEAIIILRSNIIAKKVTDLNNIKSYLVTISSNLIWNTQKKKRRNEEKIRLLFEQNSYKYVEDNSTKDKRIELCKSALLSLSDRCQKILTSFYVHKTRLADIAVDLGLSSADVAKTTKARCYKAWKEKIRNSSL